MTLFHRILANTLVASTLNMFVWFAVTFWAYLETRSVIVTSVMAGIYLISVASGVANVPPAWPAAHECGRRAPVYSSSSHGELPGRRK